jgi:hypothetical protein
MKATATGRILLWRGTTQFRSRCRSRPVAFDCDALREGGRATPRPLWAAHQLHALEARTH